MCSSGSVRSRAVPADYRPAGALWVLHPRHSCGLGQRRRTGLWFRHEQKGGDNPMQTSAGQPGDQWLARARATAWPACAAAAGAALAAVPCPDPAARLLAARMAGPRPRPNRWGPPVDADPDPHLVAAAQALAAVADLLVRHATPPTSAEAARDADLARRRIAEAFVIGSHATFLGVYGSARPRGDARGGVAM